MPLYPSADLYPSAGLWPAFEDLGPTWSPTYTYTPKPGLPTPLDGSVSYGPNERALDLGDIILAGGITTRNPYIQGALEGTGLFVRT